MHKKTPKTIRDITDSNSEKKNEILIVFGKNIFDITGHKMAVHIPSSPNVCCCINWEKQILQMQHEIKKKKEKTSINLIISDT